MRRLVRFIDDAVVGLGRTIERAAISVFGNERIAAHVVAVAVALCAAAVLIILFNE